MKSVLLFGLKALVKVYFIYFIRAMKSVKVHVKEIRLVRPLMNRPKEFLVIESNTGIKKNQRLKFCLTVF